MLGPLPPCGPTGRPLQRDIPDAAEFGEWLEQSPSAASDCLRTLLEEESIVRPEDLLRRRTDWGAAPDRPFELEGVVLDMLSDHLRETAS